MNMTKCSLLTSNHLIDFYTEMNNDINTMSNNIMSVYNYSNDLYNHSSAMEDIIANNLTTFYNKINSITYSYTNSETVFNELFKSSEYIDKKFVVSKPLNIDSDNMALTLGIKETLPIQIVSVIVEPDSNGSAGNSLDGFKNSNIESIFDDDLSTIYEYERYTNVFDTTELNLVLTIKLASPEIINSLYIKLFSGSNSSYALIKSLECSYDSVRWQQLNDYVDSGDLIQNDHYIRFTSLKIGYIRITLSQNIAEVVDTNFGVKNRYSIGVRGITVSRSEFESTGDYVSIPFVTGSPISKVKLSSTSLSNNDIIFYISANNGGKWIEITPNLGKAVDLLTLDTGVMLPDNLRSIRVRINIVRKASQQVNFLSQTFQTNNLNSYILKYAPITLSAVLGGHISYGDIVQYNISMPTPFNVLNDLYLHSGYKIKNTGTQYIIYDNAHQTIPLGTTSTLAEAYNIIDLSIQNNIGKNYTQTLRYVPYSNTINEDLDVMVGAEVIDRSADYTYENETYTYILSRIVRHPSYMHSILFLDLDNLCQFYKENEETDIVVNIGAETPSTTTTTTTESPYKTVYLFYSNHLEELEELEGLKDFYISMQIDGSNRMNGRFSEGNLGDFSTDSRIEITFDVDFNSSCGNIGNCNDDWISVIKVTFMEEVKIAMHMNFGYNMDSFRASKFYAENPKDWPPFPWDNGPAGDAFPFNYDGVDMDNCITINPSMLNTDNSDTLFYIDYYTYPH